MQWLGPSPGNVVKRIADTSVSGMKGKQQLARDMLTILNTHYTCRHLEAVNALLALEAGQLTCVIYSGTCYSATDTFF